MSKAPALDRPANLRPRANQIVSLDQVLHVRDHCLCLHAQRAARALARRFDVALRPVGLTNQQFSLLMALNRPAPPAMAPVAELLGMDRTSLTAALKPLVARGLVEVKPGDPDRRQRLLWLTEAGEALLASGLPIWRAEHAALEAGLTPPAHVARAALNALAENALPGTVSG